MELKTNDDENFTQYRVLSIESKTMHNTDQDVLQVEMSKVEYSNFRLPDSGLQPYNYSLNGELFIISEDSPFVGTLVVRHYDEDEEELQLSITEEIITIDLREFVKKQQYIGSKSVTVYFHKGVKLL